MNKGNYGLAKNRTYTPEESAVSKHIYRFQASSVASFDYIVEKTAFTDNVFDLIKTTHAGRFRSSTLGKYEFDNFDNLFQRNRAFKIKANILFKGSTNTTAPFNMRFGLSDYAGNLYVLAVNNGNLTYHNTPDKAIADYYSPVNLEIMLLNATNVKGLHSDTNTSRAQANGFYQYNGNIYNSNGIQDNVYVPMCHDIYNNGDDFFVDIPKNTPIKFHLDFKNSDNIAILKFTHLSVEIYEV